MTTQNKSRGLTPKHVFFGFFAFVLITLWAVPWSQLIKSQIDKMPTRLTVADVRYENGAFVLSHVQLKNPALFFKEVAIDIHWIKLFGLTAAADVKLKDDKGSAEIYTSFHLLSENVYSKGSFNDYPFNVTDFPQNSYVRKALVSGNMKISGPFEVKSSLTPDIYSTADIDLIINSLNFKPRAINTTLNIAQGYLKATLKEGFAKVVARGTGAQSVAINLNIQSTLDFAKLPQSPLKGEGYVQLPLLPVPIQFKLGGSLANPTPVK